LSIYENTCENIITSAVKEKSLGNWLTKETRRDLVIVDDIRDLFVNDIPFYFSNETE